MIIPVILSGGAGTRLWPLSRELHPKQLLALAAKQTMLQETALRLAGLDATPPLLVCNDAHRFLVAEQLRQLEIKPAAILLEPFGAIRRPPSRSRRTLPCDWPQRRPSPTPSFSCCRPITSSATLPHFRRPCARRSPSCTRGACDFRHRRPLTPNRLRLYPPRASIGGVHRIDKFVEKPNLERAQAFVDSGEYY